MRARISRQQRPATQFLRDLTIAATEAGNREIQKPSQAVRQISSAHQTGQPRRLSGQADERMLRLHNGELRRTTCGIKGQSSPFLLAGWVILRSQIIQWQKTRSKRMCWIGCTLPDVRAKAMFGAHGLHRGRHFLRSWTRAAFFKTDGHRRDSTFRSLTPGDKAECDHAQPRAGRCGHRRSRRPRRLPVVRATRRRDRETCVAQTPASDCPAPACVPR